LTGKGLPIEVNQRTDSIAAKTVIWGAGGIHSRDGDRVDVS
jgi:hypothetical protein